MKIVTINEHQMQDVYTVQEGTVVFKAGYIDDIDCILGDLEGFTLYKENGALISEHIESGAKTRYLFADMIDEKTLEPLEPCITEEEIYERIDEVKGTLMIIEDMCTDYGCSRNEVAFFAVIAY